MTDEERDVLKKRWGLDKPIWEQFGRYMVGMLTGDFGISFYHYPRSAWDVIATRIPPTLLLFGTATILSWPIGIGLGAFLAWRRGTRVELSTIVVTLFFYSMPLFWFGLIMLWFFAYMLGLFPLGGLITGEAGYTGWAYIVDLLHHLVLPLITLMILGLAGGVLLMRNSIMEVLGEDYITTAKAKGLPEKTVMYRHAARTAMLPVVTSIAISMGFIISGGVLTETIFSWPGLGRLLFESTIQMDYPVVQAAFFILAIMTILANVCADILYAYLDPRVRL
jgi:peptide/nickel transport system permease protein